MKVNEHNFSVDSFLRGEEASLAKGYTQDLLARIYKKKGGGAAKRTLRLHVHVTSTLQNYIT